MSNSFKSLTEYLMNDCIAPEGKYFGSEIKFRTIPWGRYVPYGRDKDKILKLCELYEGILIQFIWVTDKFPNILLDIISNCYPFRFSLNQA